ncbi:MAG: hypothetical protein EPO13_11560 [Actinomycetota bacterium]|nr:MAG: hypothetical protein EPO13_11560 [Actinomycetota bacterium]
MSWRAVTIGGYLVVALAGLVLAVLARRPASRVERLPIVLSRIMRTRGGRVAVLAAWAWLGLHYFAR